jgi:hypothetical protein
MPDAAKAHGLSRLIMFSVMLVNTLVVIAAVIIHYECLLRLNAWLPRLKVWSRFRIVVGVFGALVAHAFEVWCFALAYYLMTRSGQWGMLQGNFDGSFMDDWLWRYLANRQPQIPDRAASTDRPGAHLLDGLLSVCRDAEILERQISSSGYGKCPVTIAGVAH